MRAWQKDPDLVHRRRWITLGVLCVSLLVIVLDNSILNVAIPTLAKPLSHGGIGASESNLQWIVDSYTIVFAGLLLTAGSLGDRFGRYGALALGLAIFGIGSALAATSSDPSVLIGWRSLMGVGGALIMPATLSIITNVFTDPRERGRAIGVWAGVSGIGVGIGPDHRRLPAAALLVGLGAARQRADRDLRPHRGLLLRAQLQGPVGPQARPGRRGAVDRRPVDPPVGRHRGPEPTAGAPPTSSGRSASGSSCWPLFMLWELNYSSPMLDIHFFDNPRFSAASGSITLTFMALFGSIFLLTQYLQTVLGLQPAQGGRGAAAHVGA